MTETAAAIARLGANKAQMRLGTVVGYDAGSGSVSVDLSGTVMPNVYYSSNYVPTIGDQVAVLNQGAVWVVLCSTTATTSPLTQEYGEVVAQESRSSSSYGDLATAGPSVTITVPATGRVLVHFSAQVGWSDNTTDGAMGAAVAVAMSGANVSGADAGREARAYTQFGGTSYNVGIFTVSQYKRFTGLAQGSTTFTLKYCSLVGGKSADFSKRSILAIPY